MNDDQQYVILTVKMTVPLSEVPNLLNQEEIELVSIDSCGQDMGNGTRGYTGRNNKAAVTYGAPRNFEASTRKNKTMPAIPRGNVTNGVLELFMGAPKHDYTKEEIQAFLSRLGAKSTPSTAIANVNQHHKNAIKKNLGDNTWRLNPNYKTTKKIQATT